MDSTTAESEGAVVCPQCEAEGTVDSCPYAVEICGKDDLCHCCAHCRRGCAEDI